MKTIKQLLIVVCIAICSIAGAQGDLNLDDYILDTIVHVSPADSSVMDTLIVARKKVVIKKEVVVESITEIPPVFSLASFSLSFGSSLFAAPSVVNSNYAYSENITQYRRRSVHACFYTQLLETFSASIACSYSWEKQAVGFNTYSPAIYTDMHTQTVVLDTFYVGVDTLLALGENVITSIHSRIDTISHGRKNTRKTIDISLGAGTRFAFTHLVIIPQLMFSFHIPIQYTIYGVENGEIIRREPSRKIYGSYGFDLRTEIPLFERAGLIISPSVHVFNKKNIFVNSNKIVSYAIVGGFYMKL